ncbi:23061_t:CDS:2, partial [Racocetra persica]
MERSSIYWDGVSLLTELKASIRSMSMLIWAYVDESEGTEERDRLEKKSAINLLVGFAYSTMHKLREEDGKICADLKPFISNFNYGFDGQGGYSDTNLDILSCLLAYFQKISKEKKANDIAISNLNENLVKMINCVSNLEKILRTPQPLASFSFPKHAYRIGYEVENPFGNDSNNINLNAFCSRIERETKIIMSRPRPTFEKIFSYELDRKATEEIFSYELARKATEEITIEVN